MEDTAGESVDSSADLAASPGSSAADGTPTKVHAQGDWSDLGIMKDLSIFPGVPGCFLPGAEKADPQ